MNEAPLTGLRVVARARGVAATWAARLLATLGAHVVLAEPEGGSPLRRAPPFLPGGTSALFAWLTAGLECRTTILDHALLADADMLIDDTPLTARAALGLDEAAVAAAHPHLVHVSVLPFGAHGPKAQWRAEEITLQHASGEGNLLPNGLSVELFPDRPPVKIHGHFTEMQGGTAAALGALAALWARGETGGQFVDISCQDAGLAVGAFAIQRLGDGDVEHRVKRSFRYGGVIPCADGYVELLTLEQRQWHGLVRLLGEPGWARDPALEDSLERSRRGPEINRHIRAWAASRKVADIVREGQALSVPLARYHSPAEVLHGAQERARGLFQPLAVAEAGMLDVLVSPFHFDGRPLALGSAPASPLPPAGGAGGGLAAPDSTGPGTGPPPAPPASGRGVAGELAAPASDTGDGKPLAGVRVADFTVHNAGPFCTHLLGQLGAEVIKVESAMRPDAFRKPHPVYGRMGPATFDQVASTKRSVRINLKKPEGAALARRLVALTGVAAESFRPGVMARLGLGYEALRQTRPDLVMLSVSSSGQAGPEAHFAGYAPLFGAWGALGTMSGYPDGPPVEMRHVMDHTVGMNAAVALLAALHRRRATGLGCHVDVAAREVAASLLGEELLIAAAGGEPRRLGNGHAAMAPHGVYPAQGRDRWIAIAVDGEAGRAALARVIGGTDLSDAALARWTSTREADAAAAQLQAAGIAAHASWTTPEIAADPHLRARRAIIDVAEPDGTLRAAVGVPMRLSKGKGVGIDRGTPALGADEHHVYGELLGMGRAERAALEEAEVIF